MGSEWSGKCISANCSFRPGAEVQKMQLKVFFAAIAVSGNAWINVSARLN